MEPNVYRVTTAGDGSLYTWNKYDAKGTILETSQQFYNSEADAEKVIRGILTGIDRIEVFDIKNVNTTANRKVDLVMEPEDLTDRFNGMTPITKGIEERTEDDAAKESDSDDAPPKVKKAENKPAPKPIK